MPAPEPVPRPWRPPPPPASAGRTAAASPGDPRQCSGGRRAAGRRACGGWPLLGKPPAAEHAGMKEALRRSGFASEPYVDGLGGATLISLLSRRRHRCPEAGVTTSRPATVIATCI